MDLRQLDHIVTARLNEFTRAALRPHIVHSGLSSLGSIIIDDICGALTGDYKGKAFGDTQPASR